MEAAIAALQSAVQAIARRIALQGTAAVLFLAGLSFLTAALWLYLSQLRDALFASLTVGAGFVGVALLLLVAARPRRRQPARPPDDEARAGVGESGGLAPLLDAFLFGLEVALRQRDQDGGDRDKRGDP